MIKTKDVHEYIDEHHSESLEALKEFLRIPSISAQSEHSDDIWKAAKFTLQQLIAAGLENTGLIANGSHPLVYGDWLHAPNKPTILIYGHYDVQPTDPDNKWHSKPFEPEIRDGKIYARGATDDKGQILGLILALQSIHAVKGNFPVNIRVLIEGEEEFGGTAIEKYVKEHAKDIACDAVLIADTHMIAPGMPSIVYGVRGILYAEIVAKGADHDLHSGTYGGVAPNPLHSLALIIAGLKGADGRINIPGLEEMANPVTDEERQWWSQYPMDMRQQLAHEMGLPFDAKAPEKTYFPGEQEYSLVERMSARATFEVHGFVGGYQGEGAKTVIPAEARVKISLRLSPNQTAEKVLPLLKKQVKKLAPKGVDVEVQFIHGGLGMVVDPHDPYIHAAVQSLGDEYKHDVYFLREGGSIPVAPLFAEYLHAPIVFAGYGLATECLHSPNEHFQLDNFYHAIHGCVRYLDAAARIEK